MLMHLVFFGMGFLAALLCVMIIVCCETERRENKARQKEKRADMDNKLELWQDAAHNFFNLGLFVSWKRLGDGVTYASIEGGMYVVRETCGGMPWHNQTFSFYVAENVEELRKIYYGENDG